MDRMTPHRGAAGLYQVGSPACLHTGLRLFTRFRRLEGPVDPDRGEGSSKPNFLALPDARFLAWTTLFSSR